MTRAAKKQNKPEAPPLITITEIARRVKLNPNTVRSRLEDLGYQPDPSSKANATLFPFDDEMEFAIKSAKDSVSATRLRDMRAAAQLKEIKISEALGELVPMSEAIDDLQKVIAWLYQEFRVRQPKRIAPKLAKAKNVTTVKQVLKADTEKIYKGLRQNFEKLSGI